jgi:hypothetical protein
MSSPTRRLGVAHSFCSLDQARQFRLGVVLMPASCRATVSVGPSRNLWEFYVWRSDRFITHM